MKLGYRHFPGERSAIARLVRRLVTASDGVETVEFALVSIAMFTFLMGVVEFGRLYWTQSELQYAAEAGARCATIVQVSKPNPGSCGGTAVSNDADVQTYTAGQLLGVSVPGTALSGFLVTPAACGNQVSFTYAFKFIAVGLFFPQGTINLSTTACHQA